MSQTRPTAPETRRGAGTRKPPGPRSLSPLGSAPAIARDTQRFAREMWQRYGDIVRFRLLFWPAYALYHPDHLKYVLQDNHRNYDKQSPLLDSFRYFFGNGLFTNNGEFWLHQRRLMQPAFHRQQVAALDNSLGAGLGTYGLASAYDVTDGVPCNRRGTSWPNDRRSISSCDSVRCDIGAPSPPDPPRRAVTVTPSKVRGDGESATSTLGAAATTSRVA